MWLFSIGDAAPESCRLMVNVIKIEAESKQSLDAIDNFSLHQLLFRFRSSVDCFSSIQNFELPTLLVLIQMKLNCTRKLFLRHNKEHAMVQAMKHELTNICSAILPKVNWKITPKLQVYNRLFRKRRRALQGLGEITQTKTQEGSRGYQ
jgi:hypothetical protein